MRAIRALMVTSFAAVACTDDTTIGPRDAAEIAAVDSDVGLAVCAEGVPCAVDRVCHDGACVSGCLVDGRFVAPGAVPERPCHVCSPLVTIDALGEALRGTPCPEGVCDGGQCLTACLIAGELVATGTPSPVDPCRVCDPARAPDAFSPREEGARCGAEHARCLAGQCRPACLTPAGAVPAGATDAVDRCRVCDPQREDGAWSLALDGVVCGDSEVCVGGACKRGCWAGGLFHPIDAPSPHFPCAHCVAGRPLELAPMPLGALCDEGVCVDGTCSDGCVVDGVWVAPWVELAEDPCRWCAPSIARDALVARVDGAMCGTREVCTAGACRAGCVADGRFYRPGEGAAEAPCLVCDPAVALESLVPVESGRACGDGRICAFGVCLAGCAIDGLVYQAEALASGEPCLACLPDSATDRWTPRPDGTPCGGPAVCDRGVCR